MSTTIKTILNEDTNNNYFLCSKKVVDFAKPENISKPFKSGWKCDKNSEYFIAILNFQEIENHYNQLSKKEQDNFWCQEIVDGTMDVSKIKLKNLKENGIFFEIENVIGLTTIKKSSNDNLQISRKI